LIEPLRRRRDFEQVRVNGRSIRSGPVRATVLLTDGDTLVGYAIGRHVGSAVVRNRIRRRLRAAVRMLKPAEIRPGWYVLSPQKVVAEMPFDEVVCHVRRIMSNDQRNS
jgi:ribonuclease P protein component